jgi:SSS family solute:Na+ symporter
MDLLSVIILTSLGTWGLPQMVHKFYAIKNEKSIKTGAIVSTAFAVIVAGGCYFLGGFSRLFHNADIYGDNGTVLYYAIIPEMLRTLPDLLIGVVVVLVLSASMSTLSSLVLTSSSTITIDLIKDNIVKDMDEKKQVRTMRVFIAVFIIISVVIALNPPTFIAQLMGISWGALAGAFLGPFVYALYDKKTSKLAVWSSFVAGVCITVLNMFLGFFSSPIVAGAVAMIVSLIIVPIISRITPQLTDASKDAIFSCYNHMYSENKSSGRLEYFQTVGLRMTPADASLCVKCGKWEKHCPQSIPIREKLVEADKHLRPWWQKIYLKAARRVMVGKKK